MKFLTIIFLVVIGNIANAEGIQCFFTDPSLMMTYDSDSNIVKINSTGTGHAEIKADMNFKKGGVLRISLPGLSQFFEINLNKEGTDGVSNFVYPFEARFNDVSIGGCETDTIKKTQAKFENKKSKKTE
ncbi:MAG: hypothetical protein ACXVCY_06725 [Pseudobdellovibrionaceae bacterium]